MAPSKQTLKNRVADHVTVEMIDELRNIRDDVLIGDLDSAFFQDRMEVICREVGELPAPTAELDDEQIEIRGYICLLITAKMLERDVWGNQIEIENAERI